MNEVIEKENVKIEDMIYEVRGKQVMLANDVAKLYNSETKIINQVVKRNIARFPENFCFQVTAVEYKELKEQINNKLSRSQFVTLNKSNNLRGLNIKYLPYVFTEHGIIMLSGLLKSEIAVEVNIQVINAFIKLRKYVSSNLIEQKYINNQVLKNTENIRLLQESFNKISNNQKVEGLFYEGQIYDSYSLLLDILCKANKEIILIDNYIDKKLLDILRRIDRNILIVTNKYCNDDYNKYKNQYSNVTLRINNNIHDRFIIIDKKELYHCGASFKDLGKKCFAITRIEDESWMKDLLAKIL